MLVLWSIQSRLSTRMSFIGLAILFSKVYTLPQNGLGKTQEAGLIFKSGLKNGPLSVSGKEVNLMNILLDSGKEVNIISGSGQEKSRIILY